jgi:uncharacterized membrane protein
LTFAGKLQMQPEEEPGMENFATEFSIALFTDDQGAVTALDSLEAERKGKDAPIKEVAVLRKDEEGHYNIYEPGDMGGTKGAAVGAVVGALIGAVTGPGAIITGAAGAMIGGLAAKLSDTGFNNKELKALAVSLKPGTSALLAVVADGFIGEFANRMRARNAEIIHDALHPMVTEELQKEHAAFLAALGVAGVEGMTKADSHEIKGQVEELRTHDHGVVVTSDIKMASPDQRF